ncbi:ankyrin repeat domain-containing protein [Legionella anisa]|uniref:Ankyrin repeat domain-containing protein n=1 Tax=Legionella anisa TaxID=28082 RepID=A0AAX0WTX6_9GAMM|nr:ankyrin repeat domain-containing protein [Legionella anisa]AWN75636.1 ankyrin repeat domain-containing protein [Legionella anisa]KTC77142.1 Ankyrin repeats (3 copies) [Legionella anisa]MBN5935547.1 ankyrin repeat domain-containing protein [Legionella anisa]MCW8424167.1 ankyrin repeat domain-containing protein [Legionella anisa]MCW8447713.1 ankyrin repeat domain-containing protein [Legionella anisa]
MSLEILRERLQLLSFVEDDSDLSIMEKVYNAHVREVREVLETILKKESTDEEVYKLLEDYLKEHWEKTKGSAVSYTATPNTDATKVLGYAAELVCSHNNKLLDKDTHPPLVPLEFLMPGLHMESIMVGYRPLKAIEQTVFWDEGKQKRLDALLVERSELKEVFSDDEQSRMVELRSRVSWLGAKIKELEAKDKEGNAKEIDEYRNALEQQQKALHELEASDGFAIKSLNTKKLRELNTLEQEKAQWVRENKGCRGEGKWLVPAYDIATILSQYVLSADSSMLIPIEVLLDNTEDPINPYSTDYRKISSEEMYRLAAHSPESRALDETRKSLERLKSDKSNLLGHLTELIRQLRLNDASEGTGNEENAGTGAYPAIIRFSEYYQTLGKEEKAKIPDDLRNEIDLLLSLSSDSSQNMDATENLATCIATRRTNLEPLKEKYVALLSTIACSEQTMANLIQEKEQEVKQAEHILRKSLEENKYQGLDALPITKALLERLNIQVTIKSLADLRAIMTLSPEEIKEVMYQEGGNEQLASVFNDIEELVVFIHETPIDKLEAFFTITSPHLMKKMCQDEMDSELDETDRVSTLYGILSSLTPERFKLVFNVLKDTKLSFWDLGEIVQLFYNDPQLLKILLEEFIPETERFAVITQANESDETIIHLVAGNPDVLKFLLSLFIEEDKCLKEIMRGNKNGDTVLHLAADNPESLQILLPLFKEEEQYFKAITKGNNYGKNILHFAVDNPNSLQMILDRLSEDNRLKAITAQTSQGYTPLHLSINKSESLQKILQSLPQNKRLEAVIKPNNKGQTILHLASNDPDLLQKILELLPQADRFDAVEKQNQEGLSVLHLAKNNPNSLKKILELLPQDKRLEAVRIPNVLHWALVNPTSIQILLEPLSGNDYFDEVTKENENGEILLHLATMYPESLQKLIERFSQERFFEAITKGNKYGITALHWAINKPDSLEKLLERIPQKKYFEAVTKQRANGENLLHHALENLESLQKLLARIPQENYFEAVTKPGEGGKTLLQQAAEKPELLLKLLERLSPEQCFKTIMEENKNGYTVLYKATGNPEALQKLLELIPQEKRLGAVTQERVTGETMLHWAVSNPVSLKIILELLPHENRLEAITKPTKYGYDILYFATDKPDSLQMLLQLFPEENRFSAVTKQNKDGKSVLNLAAEKIDLMNIILELIPKEKRFEVIKERNNNGETALHLAVTDLEALQKLLELLPQEKRLDALNEKNKQGITPLDLALENTTTSKIIFNLVPEIEQYLEIKAKNKKITMSHRDELKIMQLHATAKQYLPEDFHKLSKENEEQFLCECMKLINPHARYVEKFILTTGIILPDKYNPSHVKMSNREGNNYILSIGADNASIEQVPNERSITRDNLVHSLLHTMLSLSQEQGLKLEKIT